MRTKKRNDIRLIAGLALLIGALFLFQRFAGPGLFKDQEAAEEAGKSAGVTVQVISAGQETDYPLEQDQTLQIVAPDGGFNTLVIKDGTVQVSDADCPDRVCVSMGAISQTGQSIICMPHQLVVRIASDSQEIDGEVQ